MATANRGYPTIALSDPPNGPVQQNALATAIDADMEATEADLRYSPYASATFPDRTLTSGTPSTVSTWVDEDDTLAICTSAGVAVPRAGVYLITGEASFSANATGVRWVAIVVGGTTKGTLQVSATPSGSASLTISLPYRMTLGQVAYLSILQTSGSDRTVGGRMTVSWLGA